MKVDEEHSNQRQLCLSLVWGGRRRTLQESSMSMISFRSYYIQYFMSMRH